MLPLSLCEIAEAVSGTLAHAGSQAICRGVATDSRKVMPGDLYIAIKGERVDGHSFVGSALEAGAVACMVSEGTETGSHGCPVITVPDPVRALGLLAGYVRRRLGLKVLGITGSNGKTTTKDMVAAALGGDYPFVRTEGNQNNELGLPLTLLRADGTHKAAILEMGMRGKGQIAYLADIARPDMGIVTNVGDTHMELLGSREAIRDAKAELVQALPGFGTAVLNWDDPLVRGMAGMTDASPLFYGLGDGAHVRAVDVEDRGLEGSAFRVFGDWQGLSAEYPVIIPLPGMHNVMNALAACSAALVLGIPPRDTADGLARLTPTGMRMQVLKGLSGTTIINDAYNASPSSMKAALDALSSMDVKGRRVAVLSNMLELGDHSPQYHEEVGRHAAKNGMDILITCGDLAEYMHKGYMAAFGNTGDSTHTAIHFADKSDVIGFLKGSTASGDVVLVKGSRGMRMEEIVESIICGKDDGGQRV